MSTLAFSTSKPRRHMTAVLLASLLIGTPISIATAAGGGGGGGGSAPSASAPRYDPAEEYRSGVNAFEAGDFNAAATHFKRVTRAARRNAEAHYFLGVSYLRAGKAKRARRPLESAVKYAPDMIIAQRDLAMAYVELGRSDDAQEVLDTLTSRQAACGTCADKAGLDQAIAAIDAAMGGKAQASIGPDTSLFADASRADRIYYQAVGLINEGDYEAALRRLDTAALAFGPHPDILTYQGFANRKMAKFEVAESYYNRALAIAPDHLGAIEYYGELKVERGDMEGARAHLARLENLCDFGCYEAEELRTWIDKADL